MTDTKVILQRLTRRRLLLLVVPHDEYLGEAGCLHQLLDEREEALDAVVRQYDGGEAWRLGRCYRQEQRVHGAIL